jgi:HD-GYP domain-containing protein (c-di-GMP phosphodiesterase class II)
MATSRQDDDFNRDLMDDFFLDFREAHQSCENTLIDLEHDPANTDLLNALFRSVHTIKGNLVYVGLKDLTPLIQSVEDVLDAVRKHSLAYDASLSDVIMLAMDKTKMMVEARIAQQPLPLSDTDLDQLCQQISRIAEVDRDERRRLVVEVMQQMEPSTRLDDTAPSAVTTHTLPSLAAQPQEVDILREHHIELNDDLRFFQHLIQPLEERSHYWKGRNARLLQMALAMNQHAGEPVEPDQLAVAVYLHDAGMAFLPIEILHKTTPLNEEEMALLREHPLSALQLLKPLKRWNQASLIVKEHHERHDGQGYPDKIPGTRICPGAKIMAIIDAFDARMHERAYSEKIKRPFVRAILEINRCSGTHFDPEWVEVFNEVARRLQNQP